MTLVRVLLVRELVPLQQPGRLQVLGRLRAIVRAGWMPLGQHYD